ncbi:MAG: Crp/Fnr family transcriptional regulator [Vicinamibacterales bacterium]
MEDLTSLHLLRSLETASGLELAGLDRLASVIRTTAIPARGAAFHEDEPCPRVFVVREGLFKQLYTDDAGNEWVKSFAREGEAFACPVALSGGRTSFASIAIEPSVVESLDWSAVEALGAADLAWQTAIRLGFQRLAELKVRRERDLLMLNAEQLYRQLAAASPDLIGRVPQKDLAAYLGVTAVGLNRIVKRVAARPAGRPR